MYFTLYIRVEKHGRSGKNAHIHLIAVSDGVAYLY